MMLSPGWRRLVIGLTSLVLSAGAPLAASAASWVITGDYVNLRRGPTTSAEIKRQLSDGQPVVERGRQGAWYEVEVVGMDGLLGWVHESLLREVAVVTPASRPSTIQQSDLLEKPDLPDQPDLALRKAVQPKPPEPQSAEPFVVPDEDTVIEEMLTHVKRRKNLPKEPKEPQLRHSGREIIGPVPIRKPGDQSRVPTELVLASHDVLGMIDAEAMETFRDSVSYLNNRAWSVAGIKLFSEIEPVGGGVVQVKTTDEWFDVPEIGQKSYLKTLLDRWSIAKDDGGPAGIMLVDAKGDLLMHQTKP